MKLLVVIPAYNEQANLAAVVEHLREACPAADFVVVNDGSTDKTLEICQKHQYPLLNLPVNLGLADAVGTGMKYAWQNGYEAAVQFDADGQHRAEYIGPMLQKLQEGYDIVCGSRFINQKKPFTPRMLGSRLISLAIRLTTGKKLSDPTSGMRMYSRRIIGEFATQINHTPEPDTISYLIKKGAKVAEIPVMMTERAAGESYLNSINSVRYMLRMGVSIILVQWFRGGSLPPHGPQGQNRALQAQEKESRG